MSYEGGRLQPWFGTRPVKEFCHNATQTGVRRFREAVRERTPTKTHRLQRSYQVTPVVRLVDEVGNPVYEAQVYTEVDYAPFVENGTGLWGPRHAKYLIVPKDLNGWLHWVDPKTGQDVFAKRVMHPGSPGAYMFVAGAGVTEAAMDAIVADHLERWRVQTEQQNHSGAGRVARDPTTTTRRRF